MKKTKRSVTTTICVVLALCVFYLIFCAVIGKKKFFPNTDINGIDVSGMTVSEAVEAVKDQFETEYGNATVDVVLNETTYCVKIADALNLDATDAVQKANDESHGFFVRGVYYIKALFGSQSFQAKPSLNDKAVLYTAIESSGLTELAGIEEKYYTIEEDEIVVTKGRGGYMVDEDDLVSQIVAMIDTGDYTQTLECPLAYSDVDLDKLYDEIYVEPTDATLDPDNDYSVTDSVTGVSFDKDAAQAKLDAASDGEEVRIELVYTEPELSKETLESYLFRDCLSTFSTTVTGTEARKTNVSLAAKACNGTILLPGEQFSFNDRVGQRTAEGGYKAAPAYENGDSVNTIGGGICQVSSTLYNACLYANLQIDERVAHSYPSSYVGLGFDATVSWGGPDYVFTNNTEYPIKIVSSYSNGEVSFSIYGTKLEDFTVKLSSELLATYKYETEYEDDDTLEEGEEKVSVSGHDGKKVQTYRSVYDENGELISKEKESLSSYKKRNKVVLRGTKEKDDDDDDDDDEDTEEETTETATESTTEQATEATTESATEAATESTTASAEG